MPKEKSSKKEDKGRATTIRFRDKDELNKVREAAKADERPLNTFITRAAVKAAHDFSKAKAATK